MREDRDNELKTVEMKSGTTAAKARGNLLTSREGCSRRVIDRGAPAESGSSTISWHVLLNEVGTYVMQNECTGLLFSSIISWDRH